MSVNAKPEVRSYWQSAQERARGYALLPKYWGLTRSAGVLNWPTLRAQFDLYMEAMERVGHFTNYLDRYLAGICGTIGLLAGIVGYIQNQDTIRATGEWTPVHIVICLLMGVVVGFAVGIGRKALKWFNTAYGDALGLENTDPVEPWRVTGIGETKLPRLAFVAEREDYYFGSTKKAGVDKGLMLFSVGAGVSMRQTIMGDILHCPVGQGRVTGITGRATRSLLDATEDAAEFKRRMGTGLRRAVAESAMFVFFAILALLTFLQIASGGGFAVEGIPEAAQQALDQAGGG